MALRALSRRREQWMEGARVVFVLAAAMWVVEVVDSLDSHRLDSDGIVPRSVSHLYGILFAPFLHASFGHLIANTIPFVLLGLTIALASAARVVAVTAIVALASGAGTWLTAPSGSVTLGASGVVFGYATYLISRGVFNRRIGELAIGVVVAVLFGGALLWGLLPHSGISWQAHLFGGIGGVLAARMLAAPRGGARDQPATVSPERLRQFERTHSRAAQG
jgi:membrane associated rhomboid family serine protease